MTRAGRVHSPARPARGPMTMHDKPKLSAEAAAFRAEFFEIETLLAQRMASVRMLLEAAEDLARRAEAEVARREPRFYTEQEFAALFQVSDDTVAKMRKEGLISHLRVGLQIRYTLDHVAEAAEVFERLSDGRRRKSKIKVAGAA